MNTSRKVSRNDPCPCGSGDKYKRCCEGKVDWEDLWRTGGNWRERLSIRGRNLLFAQRLTEILETDSRASLDEYKLAFTSGNVRRINEAVVECWPRDIDITTALRNTAADVSGLYIGDYGLEYLSRAIVRHSIYSNKLLITDPFEYPFSLRNEYNPIINPDQHRAQTLRNVNFWFAILPWIEAGLVEIIHTPADFDHQLNWDSLKEQQEKFKNSAELEAAARISVAEMSSRHIEREWYKTHILSAPDSALVRQFAELPSIPGLTLEGFLAHVHAQRARDPDFLEPFSIDRNAGQLMKMSSGAGYNIARMTAELTGSYLVTDLTSKWREIELDRSKESPENAVWAPFAKALQHSTLRYLDGVTLEHALRLRSEGRLETFRAFLQRVWKAARSDQPYDSVNAKLLADELLGEIAKAEEEWRTIDRDLIKLASVELAAGILAGVPMVASGQGMLVAAAATIATAGTLVSTALQRMRFPERSPAAFFMKIPIIRE